MDIKTWNLSDRGARATPMEKQQLDLNAGCGWLCPSHAAGLGPEFSAAAPHPPSARGGRGLSARKAEVEPGTLAGHPQPLGAIRLTDNWAGAPELSDQLVLGGVLAPFFF